MSPSPPPTAVDSPISFGPFTLLPEGRVLLVGAGELRRVRDGRVGWCAPEVMRLHALQQRDAGASPVQVKAALAETLALARQQRARGWELRAATSLAQACIDDGEAARGSDLIESVCAGFTEGFGTADRQAAQRVHTLPVAEGAV